MDAACYNILETWHIPEPGTNRTLKPSHAATQPQGI